MNPMVMKSGLIMFIIGGLLLSLVGKIKRVITKDRKKGLLYLLCVVLVFGLTGLVAYDWVISHLPTGKFTAMQLLFLAAGVGHQWAMDKYFDWPEEKHFWYKLLFTLAVAFIGTFAFSWVISLVGTLNFYYIFLTATVPFIVPFLVWETFIHALMIPVPVFKTWHYPKQRLKDPVEGDLRNPHVISLHFRKTSDSDEITHFRVKAPEAMHFGTFFYHFINDYNASHPESKIEFFRGDEGGEGWIFYFKPRFFGWSRHIDPEFTVDRNSIRENNVIICQRVDTNLKRAVVK